MRALVVPLRQGIPRGDYTVRWGVVSSDGHLLSGAFAIGVGAGRPPPQLASVQTSSLDTAFLVARFAYFAGLLLLIGLAVYRLFVFAPATRSLAAEARAEVDELESTTRGLLVFVAIALVLVGGWAAVIRQATSVARVSFWTPLVETNSPIAGALESTRFGQQFSRGLNAAAVFVGLLVLRYALRRWPPVAYPVALAAAAVGAWALVAPGLAGHAGDPGRGVLTVAVDALHVSGAAVWIGGLVHLFAVTPSATAVLAPDERARVRLDIVQRFSRLALASVVVISATGIARALWEVGAVSQIWTTGYGRTLLVKTAALGGLVALGYLNRRALARFAAVRRRAGLELALLAVVVAAVALLTDLPPAKSSADSGRGGAAVGAAPSRR